MEMLEKITSLANGENLKPKRKPLFKPMLSRNLKNALARKWINVKSNNKTIVTILIAICGWTWALSQRASNSEHQALANQLISQSTQLIQEVQDRKDADKVILDRLDGTPEKLAAISAKLDILMKRLGL
jgi:hypothetical protein